MNTLLKKFKQDIWGLLWLSLALFVGLALYSYQPTDPSFNSVGKSLSVENYCGYVGSFVADLLYQALGLAAWVLVAASLRMAFRSFTGRPIGLSRWRLSLLGLLVLVSASLMNLYWPDFRLFSDQIHLGGLVGILVSQSLTTVLNSVGVGILLWTLMAVLLVFYTERSLGEMLSYPLQKGSKSLVFLFEKLMAPLHSWRQIRKVRHESRLQKKKEMSEAIEVLEEPKKFRLKKDLPEGFFPLGEPEVKVTPQRRRLNLSKKIQRRVANWELPKLSLLEDPPLSREKLDEKEIKQKAKLLTEKLAQFSVRGSVVDIKPGPAVTLFEFKPAADVKISKITELADDLSLALSSESVRIIAPIPGRDVVGIETSNTQREGVFLKDVLVQDAFWEEDCRLPLALGRKANGEPRVVDLRKMPHLLVAGTTGSGKSVFVVSMLTGLLFRHSPKTLKLVLIDPKQVDLAVFNDLPHLVMPPIREPKKAVGALRWAIREMEKRYRSMSRFGARGLEAFNQMMVELTPEQIEEHQSFNSGLESPGHPESYYFSEQPYIVIVVEEFGDLMAVDKANVEQAVVRLAQMARACGIHLVLAMQSPRKDVVTGLIKTNIPGRISFKVASKMDSRIILDESGAERLLARGDMLFLAPGFAKPDRHHGPYLSEEEISILVDHWRGQGEPEYDRLALRAIEGSGGGYDLSGEAGGGSDPFDDEEIRDDRYDEMLAYVASQKEVSASLLQRRFRLGYPRAARMIEIFEAEGVIGPANGSKPRQVLVASHK